MRIFILGATALVLVFWLCLNQFASRYVPKITDITSDYSLQRLNPSQIYQGFGPALPERVKKHLANRRAEVGQIFNDGKVQEFFLQVESMSQLCLQTSPGCLAHIRELWAQVEMFQPLSQVRAAFTTYPGSEFSHSHEVTKGVIDSLTVSHPGILSGAQLVTAIRAMVLAQKIRYCQSVEKHADYWPEVRWMMRSLTAEAIQQLVGATVQDLTHPRAYRKVVERAAKEFGVAEELIYAIMRTESGFDPQVISQAGARGLMQIMPTTAKGLRNLKGQFRFSIEELHDPELSIHYGAQYLAQLLKTFRSQSAAIAAYNAGPTVVRKWLEKDNGWENQIPYPETREYLQKVQAAMKIYATAQN